ncbi:MAG: hypothetical protein IIU80_03770 [Clostridia bacterium]|nr:hypothetical protein [Clostridia bacterium]
MFNDIKNPGGELKAIIKIIFIIEVISLVVTGIVLLCNYESDGLLPAIACWTVGIGAAWFSAFLLHCFGQLIESSDITAGRLTLDEVAGNKERAKWIKTYMDDMQKEKAVKVTSQNISKHRNEQLEEKSKKADTYKKPANYDATPVIPYYEAGNRLGVICPKCKENLVFFKNAVKKGELYECAHCGEKLNLDSAME